MGSDKDIRVEDPLVSIVMPAFGMGAFIAQALDSVADQTYANWELLVIDDRGPEDGTTGSVNAFAKRMSAHHVELVRHERNMGVSAARNTGIEAGRGELVAFLDPDDHWFPDHLAKCVARFKMNRKLDVVTGPVEVLDERKPDGVTWIHGNAAWHSRSFPHSLAIYNFIQPSASVVRRSTVQKVQGFDTDPQLQHIEDYDLWIRLVGIGARFAFLDVPTTQYRRHADGATADTSRMRRLDAYLVAKHPSFFRESTAALNKQLLSDMSQLEKELADMRGQYNGPVLRSLVSIDRGLRWVWRRIRRLIRNSA